MSRSRVTFLLPFAPLALILFAGCAHHVSPAIAPAAPAPAVASMPSGTPAQPADFQPYTLLPTPPPVPSVVTPRHRVLHVTRVHDHVYLVDADRHLYEAGRDTQGHVYPVYRDPATRAAYPLYYDPARDNLYRVARSDDGRFYRNYVGQPSRQFYAAGRDYERFPSSDNDRPIVTDSYNTYNYNTYNTYGNGSSPYDPNRPYGNPRPFYGAYRPAPVHHAGHNNSDWLWAIPVIIGAYFLLQPHHHHAPPTVIVRQAPPVTIINKTVINNAPVYNGRPSYTASYAPPPRMRPLSPRTLVAVHRLPLPSAYAVPAARPARPLPPRVVAFRHPALSTPIAIRPRPVFRPRLVVVRPPRPTLFRRPRLFQARHVSEDAPAHRLHSAARLPARAAVAQPVVAHPTPPHSHPAAVRLGRPSGDVHSEAPRPARQPAHPITVHPRVEPRIGVRHETPRVEHPAIVRPVSPPHHDAESLRRETRESRRGEAKPARPKIARPREERKEAGKRMPKQREEKRKDTPKPAPR